MKKQVSNYEKVYSRDNPQTDSYGWIQWKGTDVCIDLHCICGNFGHLDGDFFYGWRCSECGQHYAVGQTIKMIPLTSEEEYDFIHHFDEDVQ